MDAHSTLLRRLTMIRCMLSLTLAVAFAGSTLAAGPSELPRPVPTKSALVQGPVAQAPMVQAPMVQAPMVQAPSKMVAYEAPGCCERCIIPRPPRPPCEPCGPRYESVLFAKDRCTCCDVQVPVSLPPCATGEPHI